MTRINDGFLDCVIYLYPSVEDARIARGARRAAFRRFLPLTRYRCQMSPQIFRQTSEDGLRRCSLSAPAQSQQPAGVYGGILVGFLAQPCFDIPWDCLWLACGLVAQSARHNCR
jgi:hypothetical protein